MCRAPLVSLLCFAGLATGTGLAADAQPTIDLALVSEHVVRGVERAGAAARVEVAGGLDAWRARLGATAPLDRTDPNEWTVAGGWRANPGERLGFLAEVVWTRFGSAWGERPHDFLELRARAEWLLPREAKAAILCAHDIELDATTLEVSVEHSFALPRWGAYLDCRVYVGWSDGRDWRHQTGQRLADAYGYGGAAAEVPYRIGANTSLVAGAEYSAVWKHGGASNFSGPHGRRNLVGRIGVRFDF